MGGRCGKVERIGGGEGSEGGGWGWKGRGRGGGEGGGGGGGGVWRYERSINNARRNKTISLRISELSLLGKILCSITQLSQATSI